MSSMLSFSVDTSTLVHMFLLGALGFLVAMALTPIYTTIAYKKEWWKKQRLKLWAGPQPQFTRNSRCETPP